MLNDSNLTTVDKCFMICNPYLFRPNTRNEINFNKEKYHKETLMHVGSKVLVAMETEKNVVFDKVKDVINRTESTAIKHNIEFFIDKIKNLPCEEKEDIVVLLKEWGKFIDSISTSLNNDDVRNIIRRVSTYFFITVMGYMLKAHTIMRTMNLKLEGFIELDFNTYKYISNIVGSILHELFFINDRIQNVPQFCATNIFILMKYLDVHNDPNFNYDSIFSIPLEAVTDCDCIRSKIKDLMTKLINKEVDVISYIESLPKDLYFNILKSDEYNDEKIIENFDKSKLCDRLINGDMIIGDNILGDKGIEISEVGLELNRLHPAYIKNILSNRVSKAALDELELSYTLSSQELGALLTSDYKTCKYFSNKSNRFFNLVEKDGEILLLFKEDKDAKTFFGISLFEDYNKKERTLVKFDIDRNIDYALEYAG